MKNPTPTPIPHSAAQQAWVLVYKLGYLMRLRFFEIKREFDVSPMQLHALRQLRPGAPQPMSELADLLYCDNANVTGLVDRFEEQGLIVRKPSPDDRRIRMIHLTAKGERLRRKVSDRLFEAPPGIARLSAGDQRKLRDLLNDVLAHQSS